MKIGIFNTIPVVHGGSTLAFQWWQSLTRAGYDATIFGMSRSGKHLASWRTDFKFDVLATNKFDDARDYIQQFDVVIPLSGFQPNLDEGYLGPKGMADVLGSAKATILYRGQSWGHYNRRYKDRVYEDFDLVWDAHGENLKGVAFCRDKIRESFLSDEYVAGLLKDKPIHMMRHPAFLPGGKFKISMGKGLLSVAKFTPSKHVKDLLKTVNEYGELFDEDFPIEVWGDASFSRDKYFLEQTYPELMADLYKGPYDRHMLSKVLNRGAYSIDLTDFPGDGGAQCCYIESLTYGVVPIVLDAWVLGESGISCSGRKPDDIADAIMRAKFQSDEERCAMLSNGWDYMQEHHDPIQGARDLVNFIESVL